MGEVGHVGSGPNNVYTCMIPVETVLGIWGGGMKRTEEWVNSSMIYLIHCKNFYKCHNVFPHSTTIVIKMDCCLNIFSIIREKNVTN
jgi:hypothetical protein